jgi:hypothetical protein
MSQMREFGIFCLILRACIARPSFVHWQMLRNVFMEFSKRLKPS